MVGQNVGKYRVLDRVGRGGMGTVYRAIDETLHREVAIKVLNAELNDPEVAKRFRAEAITVARLSHPGIATIYELFQHEGQWLMVMEFVRGETLEHMVERMGQLSPQRAAELCMQALAALAHAHSMGVVHRDLKPANLMITETGAVKIMDFGIARVAGTEHLTNAGFMMGTPAYMSPEQVRGEEIDARADLYAMGVVFYRLTTAKLPFRGDTPFAMAQSQLNDPPTPVGFVRSDLPPWVEPVVIRALAKKPEERFQSAAEFHEAFARCLAGLPLTTMYGSSAPTEIITTPPRALPTGSLSARGPGTGPMPSGPVSGSVMQSGQRTAAGTVPSMTAQGKAAPKKSATGLLAVLAALVVVAGVVGAVWYRSRQFATVQEPATPPAAPGATAPAEPPPAPATSVTDPAASATPPPTPTTPATSTSPGTAPGAEPPTTTGGAKSAPGVPPAGTAVPPGAPGSSTGTTPGTGTATGTGARSGARGATPPGAGTGTAPPAVSDPLIGFNNVKLYVVNGKRGNDRDVLLNFAGGQISVLPRDGGEAMMTVPYGVIAKATYVKARDPKWDPTLTAPPEGLDVGSFLRQSRHWLVVQTRDAFTILRLEDNNASRVLETFEARTGIKVDRPRTSDK